MLTGKGYPDDGDRQQATEKEVTYRDPDAASEYPDDVEDGRQATDGAWLFPYLATERHQRESGYLEALQAKGNTDDSEAKR